MICGHGSRSKNAEQEFGLLAKGLKNKFPETPVEYGFLEYSAEYSKNPYSTGVSGNLFFSPFASNPNSCSAFFDLLPCPHIIIPFFKPHTS